MKILLLIAIYINLGYFCVLISTKQSKKNRQLFFIVFLIGFLLRVGLTVFLYYYYPPYGVFSVDGQKYMQKGIEISNLWKSGEWPDYASMAGGAHYAYQIYDAIHFFLIGEKILYPELTNCFLSIITAIIGYHIAYSVIANLRIARLTLLLIAFYPTTIYRSSINGKDTLMMFLVSSAILTYISIRSRPKVSKFLLLALIIFVMRPVREYITYVLIILISLDFIINVKIKKKKEFYRFAFIIIIISGIIFIAQYRNLFNIFIELFSGSLFTEMLSHGGGYADSLTTSIHTYNTREFIKYIPLTSFRFIMTPLPWKATYKWIIPGQIVWFLLFPFFVYGIGQLIKNYTKKAFIIYSFIFACIVTYSFALIVSDPRHRVQLIPLTMMASSIGLVNYNRILPVVTIIWAIIFTGFYVYTL